MKTTFRLFGKLNNALQALALFLWIVVVLCAGFLYWDAYRIAPIEFGRSVSKNIAVPGRSMDIQLEGKRNRTDCQVIVTREFIDSKLNKLRAEPQVFEEKRLRRFEAESPGIIPIYINKVPEPLVSGEGSMINTATYSCNIWHWIWPYEVQTIIPITISNSPP